MASKDKKGRDNITVRIATTIVSLIAKLISLLLEPVFWAVRIVLLTFMLFLRIIGRTIRIIMVYVPHLVGRFLPKKSRDSTRQYLVYAGVEMTPEELVSITLVYSIVITIIAYLLTAVFKMPAFVVWSVVLITFASIWMFPYVALSMLINRRAESVEGVLPDVLSMISQNMMAGMTAYNALWSASRPEFGPLADEMQGVARSTLTGVPLTDAMLSMTNHIKSDKLGRSVRLIIQGMKSGGDLPEVLQSISRDIRMEHNLQKQMAAETNAHAVFIMFAIFFGAPLLFAISLEFVSIFSGMLQRLNLSELKGLAKMSAISIITLNELTITPVFFQFYAMAILFISGFFGAFLIGILRTGKPISGLPSIPVMTLGPIVIFIVLKTLFDALFSSLMVM